ncbi:ComF family protein [Streptomyces xinghaiensis]|uniref:Uncharacterized protein n=2 Tax=Streptomyces TaxID=1883 RepID=A0A420V180_9ACTN|nr:hypothetical protein SFRA_018260 [Streptomyces xinghaiensis]RNC72030.1 hypothetical protein DC095_020460 [Streptomyces xinghaiensis]
MCYSVHDGLESLLGRVKNDDHYRWLRYPLASLLWAFTRDHLPCIEGNFGGTFDLRVTVPSHRDTRAGVDHLNEIIRCVPDMTPLWEKDILQKQRPDKATTRRREIVPGLFSADPSVRGKRILLLDDTFTSGGTMASAAYALKRSGAIRVIGLAFGRQLNKTWEEHKDLISQLPDRELSLASCAVHQKDDWEFHF